MSTTSNTIPVAVDVDPWQRNMELGEEVASLARRVAAIEERLRMRGGAADPRQAPEPAPAAGGAPGGNSAMFGILRDLDVVARATDAAIRQMEGGDALLLSDILLDDGDEPSGLEGLKHAFDVLSALMTRIREMDAAPGAGADEEALRKAESERDAALQRAEGAEAGLSGCREALQVAKTALEAERTRADVAEARLVRLGRELEERTDDLRRKEAELSSCKDALSAAKSSLEAERARAGRMGARTAERLPADIPALVATVREALREIIYYGRSIPANLATIRSLLERIGRSGDSELSRLARETWDAIRPIQHGGGKLSYQGSKDISDRLAAIERLAAGAAGARPADRHADVFHPRAANSPLRKEMAEIPGLVAAVREALREITYYGRSIPANLATIRSLLERIGRSGDSELSRLARETWDAIRPIQHGGGKLSYQGSKDISDRLAAIERLAS